MTFTLLSSIILANNAPMKTQHKVTRTIPVQEHTASVEVFELEIPERDTIDTLTLLKKKDMGGDTISLTKEATARALATPNKPGKVLFGLWQWEHEDDILDPESFLKVLGQLSIEEKKPRYASFDEAANFALKGGSNFFTYGEEDGKTGYGHGYDGGGPLEYRFYFAGLNGGSVTKDLDETFRIRRSNRKIAPDWSGCIPCLLVFE